MILGNQNKNLQMSLKLRKWIFQIWTKNQHSSATQEKRKNPTQKKRENNNSSHNCLEIFLCQG